MSTSDPDWLEEVAPGVLVATSRFETTTSTVITGGDEAVVVDPGVHPDEFDRLVAELDRRGLRVVGGFATHAHWDHVLWDTRLGAVPRWASPTTVALAQDTIDELTAAARALTTVDEALLGRLVAVEGTALPWDRRQVRVVVHHGHQPGQAALHVPDCGVLVAGDVLSDAEIPLLATELPGPAALLSYLDGLARLQTVADVEILVPGHGRVTDAGGMHIRAHTDSLYLDALAAGIPRLDQRLGIGWQHDADEAQAAACTKVAWRSWVTTLPPVQHHAAVGSAIAAFLDEAAARGPITVAAYHHLPGEIDVGPVLASLPSSATVALPRMEGSHVTWHRGDGALEPHRLGVLQPRADAPSIDPVVFDVVLVPGRLFDSHGIRLGRGGGHYDRLLPRLRSGVPVIGVTDSSRIVPRLPTEPHDAAMTHLATERGVVALG